jgi:hypothetical protein
MSLEHLGLNFFISHQFYCYQSDEVVFQDGSGKSGAGVALIQKPIIKSRIASHIREFGSAAETASTPPPHRPCQHPDRPSRLLNTPVEQGTGGRGRGIPAAAATSSPVPRD